MDRSLLQTSKCCFFSVTPMPELGSLVLLIIFKLCVKRNHSLWLWRLHQHRHTRLVFVFLWFLSVCLVIKIIASIFEVWLYDFEIRRKCKEYVIYGIRRWFVIQLDIIISNELSSLNRYNINATIINLNRMLVTIAYIVAKMWFSKRKIEHGHWAHSVMNYQ